MAPHNAMRTKTWSFEKTTFPLKFGQNGRGAKARSQSQRQNEPQNKAIRKVGTRKFFLHSFFDFPKLVYYFI